MTADKGGRTQARYPCALPPFWLLSVLCPPVLDWRQLQRKTLPLVLSEARVIL